MTDLLHPLSTGHVGTDTQSTSAGGHPLTVDQAFADNHYRLVDGHPLPTGHGPLEAHDTRAGEHPLTVDHPSSDTHTPLVDGHPLPTGQSPRDTQAACAGGHPLTVDHTADDTHSPTVDGHPLLTGQSPRDTQVGCAGGHSAWLELRIAAELYERAMTDELAARNVVRRPTQGGNIDPFLFAPHIEQLAVVRAVAKKALIATYRRTVPAPIRVWQAAAPGIGEHQLARLLGLTGHPRIAIPHWWEGTGANRVLMQGEPHERTVSQLWSYCGHGDPDRKRQRGMTAEQAMAMGNPRAKSAVWNMVASVIKTNAGPYRMTYDAIKEASADKTHSVECVRCGPSGKPAQPGSPWSKGHINAHAIRVTGKTILRDLWVVAGQEVPA